MKTITSRYGWTIPIVLAVGLAVVLGVAYAEEQRKPTSYAPVALTEDFASVMERMKAAKSDVDGNALGLGRFEETLACSAAAELGSKEYAELIVAGFGFRDAIAQRLQAGDAFHLLEQAVGVLNQLVEHFFNLFGTHIVQFDDLDRARGVVERRLVEFHHQLRHFVDQRARRHLPIRKTAGHLVSPNGTPRHDHPLD